MTSDEYNIVDINPESSSSSSTDTTFSNATTPNLDNDNSRASMDNSEKLEHSEHFDDVIENDLLHKTINVDDQSCSPSTSRHDPVQSSLESSDLKIWIRSGKI